MKECYIKCGYEIKTPIFLSKVKSNKEKENKTKYENKNKKFSQKKISVGEIRRYQSIALNGEIGKKRFKVEIIKNRVCIRYAMV